MRDSPSNPSSPEICHLCQAGRAGFPWHHFGDNAAWLLDPQAEYDEPWVHPSPLLLIPCEAGAKFFMIDVFMNPRMDANQWPCCNRHVAMKPSSNNWGAWRHCAICNVRLEYIPRVGAHGQTTKLDHPSMTLRMLNKLHNLLGDQTPPTAATCAAMQRKIDAEEQLHNLIKEETTKPAATKTSRGYPTSTKPKTRPTTQTMSPGKSSTASFEVAMTDPQDVSLEEAYAALDHQQ